MDSEGWVKVLMAVLGLGVTITLALIRIIFLNLTARIDRMETKIEDRLRTLGHEDRDIRQSISGISNLLMQVISNLNNGK